MQRLLISLKKGSYVEPHYHKLQHQWEMFVVLEGVLELKSYNITGDAIERHLIGEKRDNRIVELSPMEIHRLECISDDALILEVKEGPFSPDNAKFLL